MTAGFLERLLDCSIHLWFERSNSFPKTLWRPPTENGRRHARNQPVTTEPIRQASAKEREFDSQLHDLDRQR